MNSNFNENDIKFQHEFNNLFKEAYNKKPKKTLRLMEMCLYELGYDKDEDLLNNKSKLMMFLLNKRNRIIIYIIFGIILGILSIEGCMIYFAGSAFFLAGHCITLFTKDKHMANLIFLFSHGLTGLLLMVGSYVGFIFEYLFSSQLYGTLFVGGVALIIAGFIRTLLIGLSKNDVSFKDNVFIFYILGFICFAIIKILVFIETGGVINAI